MAVAVSSSLKQWADSVLQLTGVPVTPTNEDTLYRWAHAESGSNPLRWNNPLNTTQSWPGAVPVNSAGVKSFPDINTGARATAATLTNGYYPDILSALQNSLPTKDWSTAARSQVTKWGTNLAFLGGSGGGSQFATSQSNGSASLGGVGRIGAITGSTSGGQTFNPFGFLGDAISGAGTSIGGGIGNAITGAEQSLAKKLIAALEIGIGGALIMLGAVILLVLVVKSNPAQSAIRTAKTPIRLAGKVGGTAASATPQGRVAGPVVAAAASKPKPAAPTTQEIRAGGRRIEVTNPESRARLRAAGVEAA